jgi:hypothetical protein
MEMATALVFDVLVTQGMMMQIAGLFELLFSSIHKIDFDHILCTYFMMVFMTTLQFEVEMTLL